MNKETFFLYIFLMIYIIYKAKQNSNMFKSTVATVFFFHQVDANRSTSCVVPRQLKDFDVTFGEGSGSRQRWWPNSPPFWVDLGILQKLFLKSSLQLLAGLSFDKFCKGKRRSNLFFGIPNVANVWQWWIMSLAWQYTAAPEVNKKSVIFCRVFLSCALLALFVT